MVNSRLFLQPSDLGGSNISSQTETFGQQRISTYSMTGLCAFAMAMGGGVIIVQEGKQHCRGGAQNASRDSVLY